MNTFEHEGVVLDLLDPRFIHHLWLGEEQQTLCVQAGDKSLDDIREEARKHNDEHEYQIYSLFNDRVRPAGGIYVVTVLPENVNCQSCLEWMHA